MSGRYIYILGSHTGTLYIGVTSNLHFRVMQHKEGTLDGFTAAYGCNRLLYFEGYDDIRKAIAREKQLKGWRREKKLDLIRTINPEFKDLAQTWGWKMITVHEKCTRDRQVRRQLLFYGLGGRKAPSSMGKISPAGVLRLRATSVVERDKAVRRSAQDDDFVGVLTKTFQFEFSASWDGEAVPPSARKDANR